MTKERKLEWTKPAQKKGKRSQTRNSEGSENEDFVIKPKKKQKLKQMESNKE